MFQVPLAGQSIASANVGIDTTITSGNISCTNISAVNGTINNLTTTIFNPASITTDTIDTANLNVSNTIPVLNVSVLNVSTKNTSQMNVGNMSILNISATNISATSFTSPDVQPLLVAGTNISILNNVISATNDALLPSNANFSSINTSSLSVNNGVIIGGTTYITDNLIVSNSITANNITANNLSTGEMQFGSNLSYDGLTKTLDVNTTGTISSGNTLPVTSGAVFNSLNTSPITISTLWSYMLSEPEFVLVSSSVAGGGENTICYLDITPQYEGSKIHVEFCFSYSVGGFGGDSIVTEIRVGRNNNTSQSVIQEIFQEWTNAQGGGTRSGAPSTIAASYTNNDDLGDYHRIQLRVDNNSDDSWSLDNSAFVSIKVIEFIETTGTSNPNILIGSGNISCGNISCNAITATNHTIDNLITTQNVNVGGSMVTVGFPESGVIVPSSMVRLAGGSVVSNWADMGWDGSTFNISTRQASKNFKVSFGQVCHFEVDETNVSVQSLRVNQGLEVIGTLTFTNLTLNDSLLVNGNLLASNATFDNDVVFERDVDIEQTLNVSNINVSGNVVVTGTLTGPNISTAHLIPGTNITIVNDVISAFVESDADIVVSSLHVDNDTNIYGILNVSETSNFEQSLNVENQLFVGKAGQTGGHLVLYSTNIGDNFQIQNGVTETSFLGTGNISRFNFSLLGNQTLTIKPTEVNISGDLIVSGNIVGTLDFNNLSVTNLSVVNMTVDLIQGDLNAGDMFASSLTTTGRVETGKWLIGSSDSTTASLYNKDITSVTTHYALRQTDGAATSINGTAVYFKNLGVDVGEWTANGLGVGKTNPTNTLDVSGDSFFAGEVDIVGDTLFTGDVNVCGLLETDNIESANIITSDFNLSEGSGQSTKIYRTANQTLFVGNNNTAGSDYVFYPLTSSDQPALQIKRDLTTVIQDLQVVALIEAANICTDNNISCTGSITIGDDLHVDGNVSFASLNVTDLEAVDINCSTLEVNQNISCASLIATGHVETGKWFIGASDSTTASLYNKDVSPITTHYALRQTNGAATSINGTGVYFKNLGVDVGEWNATGLGVGKTTPSKKLDVLGDSLFTGNVNISGTLAADQIVGIDLLNICSTNISTTNLSASETTSQNINCSTLTLVDTVGAGGLDVTGLGYFRGGFFSYEAGYLEADDNYFGDPTGTQSRSRINFFSQKNAYSVGMRFGCDSDDVIRMDIPSTGLYTQYNIKFGNTSTMDMDNTSTKFHQNVNISGTLATQNVSAAGHIETGKWFIGASDSTTASLYNKDISTISTHYALRQTNGGGTSINGTGVFFKNLGVDVGEWTATGLGVGKTTPTKKLDVLGDSLFTGNVNISGTLAADNITGIDLANICSTNISTSNLSTNKITFLTTYGLYQDFTGATNVSLAQVKGDILSALGATFSATTLNSSTLNSSVIKARNIYVQDLGASLNFSAAGVLNNNETGCVTNLKTCNISTLNSSFLDVINASVSNDLQVDGILDTFDLVSDTGSIGVLDSTTTNVSTLNASTINGDNLSTASILFNSDFQFSLNTLSLAPSETSAAIQSATLSTIATQVDSLFGNFSTFNSDFGTIGGVLNMQFANTSQINASNVIGLNVSADNISCINLSATEISTSSATMGSDTLTMATDKYLESVSNYASYHKNSNTAMTGTSHLVGYEANTLESALITKTSNSRYTINRAGYYLVTCTFHPENLSINDRVCYRAEFQKNGVINTAWSGDSFCYTRDDNFGEFGTCANTRIISLAVNDYIEVIITCKIGSVTFFGSDLTGSLARRRSGLVFQYLGS